MYNSKVNSTNEKNNICKTGGILSPHSTGESNHSLTKTLQSSVISQSGENYVQKSILAPKKAQNIASKAFLDGNNLKIQIMSKATAKKKLQ